ncbi:hypothetical protein [Streptomyces sp. NPDC053560]|uniref:hypothetical protein n=1 Tax=Streptomyces sp. NPDC053560 TaxID=3365711 RepID=UPI0037D2665C
MTVRPITGSDITTFHAGRSDLLVLTADGRFQHLDYSDVRPATGKQPTPYEHAAARDGAEVLVLVTRAVIDAEDWLPDSLDDDGRLLPAYADTMAELILADGILPSRVRKAAAATGGARARAVAEVIAYCGGDSDRAGRLLGEPAQGERPGRRCTQHPTDTNRGRLTATHGPQKPAYPLPPGDRIATAVDESLAALGGAQKRVGRVMAVVTAAAVRDVLTGHDADTPFDAGSVELTEGADGSLFATGRYWTAAGEERRLTDGLDDLDGQFAIGEMGEWTPYLDDTNRDVWRPLCEELPERDGRKFYRMDLIKAAALPLD